MGKAQMLRPYFCETHQLHSLEGTGRKLKNDKGTKMKKLVKKGQKH